MCPTVTLLWIVRGDPLSAPECEKRLVVRSWVRRATGRQQCAPLGKKIITPLWPRIPAWLGIRGGVVGSTRV